MPIVDSSNIGQYLPQGEREISVFRDGKLSFQVTPVQVSRMCRYNMLTANVDKKGYLRFVMLDPKVPIRLAKQAAGLIPRGTGKLPIAEDNKTIELVGDGVQYYQFIPKVAQAYAR